MYVYIRNGLNCINFYPEHVTVTLSFSTNISPKSDANR